MGQFGCVRHSSVGLHESVLINTHSGWITLSVGTDGLHQGMKQTPLAHLFSSVPSMCNASSCLLLCLQFLIKRGCPSCTHQSLFTGFGEYYCICEKRCSLYRHIRVESNNRHASFDVDHLMLPWHNAGFRFEMPTPQNQ